MSGVTLLNTVALLGFLAALLGAARVPRERVGVAAKLLLCAALLVYVFASVSNVLEHSGVSDRLDAFEDYAEILLFPLLLYAIYSMRINRELDRRRRAETALRESKENYRLLVENQTDLIVKVDVDSRLLFVSPSYCDLFGKRQDELLGTRFLTLVHEADREATARAFEAARRPPYRGYHQHRALTRHGWRWLAWVDNAVVDADGNVAVLVSAGRDVTERKEAEEALRRAEVEKQTILDSLVEHVTLLDRDRTVLWANRAACDAGGAAREELIGRSCAGAFPHCRPPCDDCPALEAIETGQPQQLERATSEGRTWLVRGYPVRDAQGTVVGAVEASLEITERKRAEEALREARDNLSAVIDASPVAIVALDLDGTTRMWNPAAERTFGWTADEALGRSLVVVPDDRRAEFRDLLDQVAHGAAFTGREIRRQRKDGSPIDVSLFTARLHDPDGTIAGVIGVLADVTERKRAEAERRELESQLLQAQKMESIGRLAGGIAHDLNNLLLPVLGHADMALMSLVEQDPLREDLRGIRDAALRARNLTRQLLAFSRKQVLEMRLLDLDQVVAGFERTLGRLLGENIEIRSRPAADLGAIQADPSQIELVLLNLAVNARDAMPDGGVLTIQTANATLDEGYVRAHPDARPGPHVALAVTDDGVGMDSDTLGRIFEPFFTTKDSPGGTGLGLSTVYGIVQQHGGHIRVDSQPGKGTTVTVCLPRVEGVPEPLAAAPAALPGARGTETILVVEDDDVVRKLACRMLQAHGYATLPAPTPDDALRLADSHDGPIHLLLTDIVMPGMKGPELRQRLAARRPEAKALFTSGYTQDIVGHHGVLEAGVHFLQKPYSVQSLIAKVRETLGA